VLCARLKIPLFLVFMWRSHIPKLNTTFLSMFVSLWGAQTWRLHIKLYNFGWHTSANGACMKKSRDLILGGFFYIAIIYNIPDSLIYLLNGYDFSFDPNWWKPKPRIYFVSLCRKFDFYFTIIFSDIFGYPNFK